MPQRFRGFRGCRGSGWGHHRTPWDATVERLATSLRADDGPMLVASTEQLLNNGTDLAGAWVGFVHWCPHVPSYLDRIYPQPPYDLAKILDARTLPDALRHCEGLFCLSPSSRAFVHRTLRDRGLAEVPVHSVWMPTATDVPRFDEPSLSRTRDIVMLGHWLRRLSSLAEIALPSGWNRIWLRGDQGFDPAALIAAERNPGALDDVHCPEYLDAARFDELMRSCIVFLDLWAASANNAVVECVARGTPLIVNRVDGVVDYLGEDYPLYFDTLADVEHLAVNRPRQREAHRHLIRRAKQLDLSFGAFRSRVATAMSR
ncbi:MAG: hypothetical protein R3F29_09445 [Planctomycetota bacterium]